MDNLSGLAVFVQTAQSQSFVAAGRLMGISASAVSKSISRLEERLGVRLFQRSTRAVRLTSEGEVFLERCRRIFAEIEAAEQDLSSVKQLPRGRLRVGLPFAGGMPLPVLSSFMQRYPEIELDLDFSDRVADLIQEGFDVVIRGGELSDSRLMSRRLGTYRVCLVAAPNYLKKRGVPVKPDDLLHHACLHYRYPTSGKLEPWPLRQSAQAAEGATLPATLVSSSLDALLYMVKDGRGIACVPDFAVKGALADGCLQSVLDAYMTRSHTFRVVWSTSRHMTPKVRVFVDFVIENFPKGLVTKSASRTRG